MSACSNPPLDRCAGSSMWLSKRSVIAVNPFRFKAIRAVTSLLGQTATLVLLAFWIPVDIGSPPEALLCFLQQRRRLLLGPYESAARKAVYNEIRHK